MNILHFSTADAEGGSARSAYRIHTGLRSRGLRSRMLVGKKVTDDSDVALVAGNIYGQALDRAAEYAARLTGRQYLYVPSSKRLLLHPWVSEADIIQLFNTHGGYFSHTILPELSKRAPIVWRLSDLWPLTPHSAYTYGCECYKKGPEHCICPLTGYPPIYRNTKKLLWDTKARIYDTCDITVVAPSRWIEKAARESILFSRFPVHYIANGIDTKIFYPREKKEIRRKLSIPLDTRVILFSAHGLDNNPRKGSAYAIEALQHSLSLKNVLLLLVGEGGESFDGKIQMPIKRLGYIKNREQMAEAYSAADLSIVPSVVENLPNNLLESMACGTPAVAFDTGGIGDAVLHKETGYLAKYCNGADLAHGIKLLIEDEKMRKQLGHFAQQHVAKQFSLENEINSFIALYEQLQKKRSGAVYEKKIHKNTGDINAIPETAYGFRTKVRLFIERIEQMRTVIGKEISVLDIGCGNGVQMTFPLAAAGYEVTGVDMHEPSIVYAKLNNRFKNANFFVHDSNNLREIVKNKKYDVIILSDILEHVENPTQLLVELSELLTPHGIMLISIPNGYGPFEVENFVLRKLGIIKFGRAVRRTLARLRGHEPIPYNVHSGHIQFFTKRSFAHAVHSAGLKISFFKKGSFLGGSLSNAVISKIPLLTRFNIVAGQYLPARLCSVWYFECRKK